MNKRTFLPTQCLRLFQVAAVVALGISNLAYAGAGVGARSDPYGAPKIDSATSSANRNQLKDASNASAALHKSQGLRRSTTNDDRQAAAQRNAARKAAAAQGKGGRP